MSAAAATYWSHRSVTGYAPNWYSLCADEITHRVTGQSANGMTTWLIKKHAPSDANRLLEIGCLNGRKVAQMGKFAKHLHGIDYAADAIEAGRTLHPNIDLSVIDLNSPIPLGVKFDIILSNGVLHHIENLEAAADWIVEHLTPRGRLIGSEYVGPVRYRYSRAEIAAINAAVRMLPSELQQEFDPAQLAGKLKADPSESIRSRDILDTLRAAGVAITAYPYGGNTAARALSPTFFRNFDPTNEAHLIGVRRVIASDWQAMNQFPSHNVAFVARPHIS